MGNIYGGTFKVNTLKADGFRIIADGAIKLNNEIPTSKTYLVNDSSSKISKIELDFTNIKSDGRVI